MKNKLFKRLAVVACATTFVACNTDANDKKCGAQMPCANGMICVEHKCVVPECSVTKSCEAAEEICNDEGLCVSKTEVFECGLYTRCANDLDCIAHRCVDAECSLTKKCKTGMLCNDNAVCVDQNNLFQCGLNLACADAALKCNAKNLCVECTDKADCIKGDCNDEGICIEPCTELPGAQISWDTAILQIDELGLVASMLTPASDSPLATGGYAFCALETEEGTVNPSSVTQCGSQVVFNFPSGQRLVFRVSTGPSYSYWKVMMLEGDLSGVKSVQLGKLSFEQIDSYLYMTNTYVNSSVIRSIMATTPNVRVSGGGVSTIAETVAAHGLGHGGFGIVVGPTAHFAKHIENFELGSGVPSPHPEGVWSKLSPASKKSYLFITDLTDSNAQDVVTWAKRGAFGAVLVLGWANSGGHYELNEKRFSKGIESLRSAFEIIKKAGFHVGLHFLAPSVDLNDAYVTPIPDRRLVKDLSVTLAGDVTADAKFLTTIEATDKFPIEDGGYMGKGRYLHVGDEIIEYDLLSTSPNGFHVLQRGALGTTAAAHASGTSIGHLLRSYGYFMFDIDTDLATEVTGRVASVANAVGADMLYLDGSEALQGDHWYYNARLHDLYYQALDNPDTFVQASSFSHYSWHIISRTASADGHGDVKHYLDERMDYFPSLAPNLLPLDIGWYYLFDTTVTEDQFEYILQKSLGFKSSVSIETSLASLKTHPVSERIIDLVSQYETLRLANKIPEATLALLREPGREYRLLSDPLRLRRVEFVKVDGKNDGDWREVTALDGVQNILKLTPTMPGCRLGLQVRAGKMITAGMAYKNAFMIDDLSNPASYDTHTNLPGVSSELIAKTTDCAVSSPCINFSAVSALPDASGWSYFGRTLATPLDLSKVAAFGFWMLGDGQGGSFKLQFTHAKEYLDMYITNDFTGWKYIEIPREANKTFTATRIGLYYNSLPANSSINCAFDDIKALSSLEGIVNPSITVGTQTLTFETSIPSGHRLIYFPGSKVEIVPAKQGSSTWLPAPTQEITPNGPITVTFSAQEPLNLETEVRIVEDCPEELPLP